MLEPMADNAVGAHNQGFWAGPRAVATSPTRSPLIETASCPVSPAPTTDPESGAVPGAFLETVGPQVGRASLLPVSEDDLGIVAPVKVRVPAPHTPDTLSHGFDSGSLFAGSPGFSGFIPGLFFQAFQVLSQVRHSGLCVALFPGLIPVLHPFSLVWVDCMLFFSRLFANHAPLLFTQQYIPPKASRF